MAVLDDKVYVTGGRPAYSALTDPKATWSKTGEVLDLVTMQWTRIPKMTTTRCRHGKQLFWLGVRVVL